MDIECKYARPDAASFIMGRSMSREVNLTIIIGETLKQNNRHTQRRTRTQLNVKVSDKHKEKT